VTSGYNELIKCRHIYFVCVCIQEKGVRICLNETKYWLKSDWWWVEVIYYLKLDKMNWWIKKDKANQNGNFESHNVFFLFYIKTGLQGWPSIISACLFTTCTCTLLGVDCGARLWSLTIDQNEMKKSALLKKKALCWRRDCF